MLPAFPAPVLLAEMLAPFVNATDWPAAILMSPPAPLASAFVNNPLLDPVSVTGPVAFTVRIPPLPEPWVVADIVAPFCNDSDRTFNVMSPPLPFEFPTPLIRSDPAFTGIED